MARRDRPRDYDEEDDRPARRPSGGWFMPVMVCSVVVLTLACCGGGVLFTGIFTKSVVDVIDEKMKPVADGDPAKRIPHDQPAEAKTFKVEIVSAKIGKITRKMSFGDGTFTDKDDTISFVVRVTNTSDTKFTHYSTWADSAAFGQSQRAKLKDEHGNSYFIQGNSSSPPVGSVKSIVRVDPGKSVEDVLVFDLPVEKANDLTLALPGAAVAGGTNIEFRIPRSAIKLNGGAP